MKASTFAKTGLSVSAAAALTLGLCASSYAAGPTATQEDPTTIGSLVGVGSDTTQDVMYGIAHAIGNNVISSYTATGGATITYRSGGTAARPNGSGAGYTALKDSIGLTANTSTSKVAVGDVDFARASGTQGAAATGTSGVTTDIPFAVDTLSVAVPAGSPFLLTNGGGGLSITDLGGIYARSFTYIGKVGGTAPGALVNTATGSADPADYEPIHAFLPKAKSGSRQFFLKSLKSNTSGIDYDSTDKGDSFYTDAYTSATAPYVGAKDKNGADVQEHDATVLTSEPSTVAAIAPFSGAKFIGYHNSDGIADPDAGKVAGKDYVLVPFKSNVAGAPSTGVLPYSGDASSTAATLAPSTTYTQYATKGSGETGAFSLFRDVYNIIPTAAVKGGGTSSNARYNLLYKTFVGAGSDVCKQTAAIAKYGFLPKGAGCGDTSLTFDAPSTSTATVTAPTGAKAGAAAVFHVGFTSNGNGGATATIVINGKSHTGTIAAGATAGTVSVSGLAAGTYSYEGFVTPNLGGVATAPIEAGSFAVAKVAPVAPVVKVGATVKAVAPKVKHTKKAKVTVTVTASRTVPTGTVTVVVKKGSKTVVTVKNKALAHGKAAVTLPKKLKKGSYKVFVSYTGDAKVNAVALKPVTTLKVK